MFSLLGIWSYAQSTMFASSYGIRTMYVDNAWHGYYLAGTSISVPDFILARIDSAGNLLWSNSYGITMIDDMQAAARTPEGGFIMAGVSDPQSSSTKFLFLVRTDSLGALQWRSHIDIAASFEVSSVKILRDSSILVTGHYTGASTPMTGFPFVMKLDPSGSIVWMKSLNFFVSEADINSVDELPSGDLVMGGMYFNGGSPQEAMIVRTDANINSVRWIRLYVGGYGTEYGVKGIIADSTRITFVSGISHTQMDVFDVCIAQLDTSGALLTYSVFNEQTAGWYHGIRKTSDGGFIAYGQSLNSGVDDFVVVKVDSALMLEWSRRYGTSSTSDYERAYSVQETSDGGFIIGGSYFVIKTDSSGFAPCYVMPGAPPQVQAVFQEDVTSVPLAVSGLGQSMPSYNIGPTPVVLPQTVHCLVVGQKEEVQEMAMDIYPNPSSGSFSIRIEQDAYLEVHDMLGKKLRSAKITAGNNQMIPELPAGIYLLHLANEKGVVSRKLIVQ
jgi:hypothetical protein